MASVIIPWGLWLLYLGFRVWGQPLDKDRTTYWQTTVEGLDEEPDVFYGQVYQALKEGLASRDVQLSGMGFGPTKLFETTSVLSSRPLYLEARYKHLRYYLYLGQTPTGLFLSSRVYNRFVKGDGDKSIVSYAALKYFQRQTMFQYDAAIMFQESVHAIVLSVLDSYIEEKQLKPLEEYERRPILHAYYANAYPQRPQQIWAMPAAPGATPMPSAAPMPHVAPAHALTATANLSPSTQADVTAAPKVLPLEPDTTIGLYEANDPSLANDLSHLDETSVHSPTTSDASSTRYPADDPTELHSELSVPILQDATVTPDQASHTTTFPNSIAEQTEAMPSVVSKARPQSGRVLPL